MKKFLTFILEITKILVIALAIVIPIRYFLFQPFFVKGQSMQPSFESGDYLIIDEITYRFKDPQRGEVVVFKYPQNISQRFIKRIVGLPGETVEVKDGEVIIYNDQGSQALDETGYISSYTAGDVKIVLSEDQYFVMGDNRNFSFDSRKFGIVPKKLIIGKVLLRAWPFVSWGGIEVPSY